MGNGQILHDFIANLTCEKAKHNVLRWQTQQGAFANTPC